MSHFIPTVLDLRPIFPGQRHGLVFAALDELEDGTSMLLRSDHDPQLLFDQMTILRRHQFYWMPQRAEPEIWEVEICKREGARMESVTEFLETDHRRIDALLDNALAAWQEGFSELAIPLLEAFAYRLRRHIRMEEEILFPQVEEAGAPVPGPTHVMRMEHRDMQGPLEDLGNASAALPDIVDELQERLAVHNHKEEGILYPLCDRLLGQGVQPLIERMCRLV